MIESSLLAARFYIPYQKSERWYREQLDGTGITYAMVLGRPHIPRHGQYPAEEVERCVRRDQRILDDFRAEYERRHREEDKEVDFMTNNEATIVAHVVYSTG